MGMRNSRCHTKRHSGSVLLSRMNTSFKQGSKLLYGFHIGKHFLSANPPQRALTTGRAPSRAPEGGI